MTLLADVTTDLEDVFDTAELCENVTIRGSSVPVFFTDDSVDGGGRGGPRALARTAALPAGTDEGDSVVRGSTTYKLMQLLPNGHGLTELVLR